MPQLPEADGSEWQVEDGEGGSWKKPHFGDGQHRQLVEQRGNTDLEMDESHGSVSNDESLTSGNTEEGELELTQFEDRSNSSNGRSKSMEEMEATFDIEPIFDSRCLDQQEAAMVVRGEVLDNSLPRSPEDSYQRDNASNGREPIYRSRPEEQVEDVLLSEGEWSSGLAGVTGPFLAARKSKSPIQGTFSPADLVHEGRAQKDDLEDNQAACDQTHSIQNNPSPTRVCYEHAEQTWEGEDLTLQEDPTQKEKSSTDLQKREFVPNDLIPSEQVSGISDVRNLIVADPSQQDLMTGNILDEKHSPTEDPDNHNDGCVGRISPNGENEDEREGEDLQINQDCQNSKLPGPPLVEQTEDQEENEMEEMKNEMQRPEEMQRLEDQDRLSDKSEQMVTTVGERQGGQIEQQPSSESMTITFIMIIQMTMMK